METSLPISRTGDRRRSLPPMARHAMLAVILAAPGLLAVAHDRDRGRVRDVVAISDEGVTADSDDPSTLVDDDVKFFDAGTGRRLSRPVVPPNTG